MRRELVEPSVDHKGPQPTFLTPHRSPASRKPLSTIMSDSKDVSSSTEENRTDQYEKVTTIEGGRRRSTVADINRGKNLDAK